MLQLDNDYTALGIILKGLTERMKVPFVQKELNSQGYGDALVYGLDGIYSAEIKGEGEYLGDTDHLIAQTKAQMQNADFMYVFKYGERSMAPDGNSYSLKLEREDETWNKHPDSGVVRRYRRRHHRTNYHAQRKILWRFRNEGIHVVECRDLDELAYELCLWEQTATTVGTTFTRLNVEKFRVKAETKEREDFMASLMGIRNGGVGEEMADAVASWVENAPGPMNLCHLLKMLEFEERRYENSDQPQLAAQPLRSGKRTIGPAAVQKLKAALGVI